MIIQHIYKFHLNKINAIKFKSSIYANLYIKIIMKIILDELKQFNSKQVYDIVNIATIRIIE
jgi:hypothetical protein